MRKSNRTTQRIDYKLLNSTGVKSIKTTSEHSINSEVDQNINELSILLNSCSINDRNMAEKIKNLEIKAAVLKADITDVIDENGLEILQTSFRKTIMEGKDKMSKMRFMRENVILKESKIKSKIEVYN